MTYSPLAQMCIGVFYACLMSLFLLGIFAGLRALLLRIGTETNAGLGCLSMLLLVSGFMLALPIAGILSALMVHCINPAWFDMISPIRFTASAGIGRNIPVNSFGPHSLPPSHGWAKLGECIVFFVLWPCGVWWFAKKYRQNSG